MALSGNLKWVPLLVGISLFADFLDGLVARALKVSSELGKQLDSLADMVSFGVLPGVILYVFLDDKITYIQENIMDYEPFYPIHVFLIYFVLVSSFFLPIFSAIRLAKFNIDENQSEEFIGLATPASAMFVMGLLMQYLFESSCISIYYSFTFLCLTSIVLSLLMVAPIPMFSFKLKSLQWKDAGWQYVFIILSVIALVIFKFAGISVAVGIYVVLNIVRYVIHRISPNNYQPTTNN